LEAEWYHCGPLPPAELILNRFPTISIASLTVD
jgi:hypothetical protein